ncbi:unnamed protein product [Diamesa hyperborea]
MGYDNFLTEDHYKVPLIAKLLHTLPHYNITFHRTNNTFKPTDEIYLESLGILGSVPAALLIISLFGLLLYLMTRCCDRKPRPAHSITSLKVTLSVVTVLCCAAIGLGLYGNDDLHNGLLEVLTAGRKVDNLVSSVRNQTNALEHTLTQKIRPQLTELADIFDQPASNQTALQILLSSLEMVQKNITIATNAAGDIRRPLMGISMSSFLSKGDQYELIRWPGTVAVLALLLVLCAVLLVGVARHSRCALILFSVCGLLAVTGSWLMSGLYLSSSVAVGDLCTDPAEYLVSQAPPALPSDVLLYYTQCESIRSNPFTQRLRESQNAISSARNSMNIVSKISLELFRKAGLQPKLGSVQADLNTSERLLTGLTALVDCKPIHYNYLAATRGLCEGGLLGLVLMLVASFIAAILLTIMVWVDSHTWIYIRKRNDYAQVEEQSYVSHQQQQQAQNHQNQIAHRTLPRQQQQNGPPAISGSHTLQHPNKNKHHEMMQAQSGPGGHHHPMRQIGLGTQTLGRHHSPNHMACAGHDHPHPHPHQQQIYQQQQQQQQQHATYGQNPHPPPPHAHYKQYNTNQTYSENLPMTVATTTSAPPQTISGNSNYTQQQQIYMQQQQQIYQAHQQQQYQTLRRKSQPANPQQLAAMQQQHQQQHQQQQLQQQQQQTQQQLPPPHPQLLSQQPLQNNTQMLQMQAQIQMQQQIYQQQQNLPPPPQIAHVSPQQQQPQVAHIPPQQHPPQNIQQQPQYIMTTVSTPAPPSATMAIAQPNNSIYVQSKTFVETTIPNSIAIDSAMYERDKQIYKCSTLRHGGKYVPTQPAQLGNNVANIRPSIQNCPLPEIPKHSELGQFKDLPQNRYYTQKRVPTGKAIPLPKIGSFDSNPPPPSLNNNINNNNGHNPAQQQQQQQQQVNMIGSDNNSNIKNTINNNNNISNSTNNHLINNNSQQSTELSTNALNDEKNSEFYAVTEL